MIVNRTNINLFWASIIIEEYIRNNVNYFCISPGSRSTPLTISVAKNPKANSIMCFDERNAAFHALGYARATGRPAVVISTSGTAAANHFPAIIEASMDNLPLIVLSADRPPELHENGANQTIDQTQLFGNHVKWFYNLPCPDVQIEPEYVMSTVDQSIHIALSDTPGPVHLNCMYREPLTPTADQLNDDYAKRIRKWESAGNPYTMCSPSVKMLKENVISEIATYLNKAKRGLVIVGRLHPFLPKKDLVDFLNKLEWPVFADFASGLRDQEVGNNIFYYDRLLHNQKFSDITEPETILHIGGAFISKNLLKFTKKQKAASYLHVTEHNTRVDPENVVTHRYEAGLVEFSSHIIDKLSPYIEVSWLEELKQFDRHSERMISKTLFEKDTLNEPAIAHIITEQHNAHQNYYIGNSMPIRDMDMFLNSKIDKNANIGVNRGTSGIDGNIASALGFAVGLKKPLTVLIGDLAFQHNMNALNLMKKIKSGVILIVINNDGGGIFSFLPVAEHDDFFEDYFGTPHGLHFSKVAEMYDIEYYCPETIISFREIYTDLMKTNTKAIIEIVTDRKENFHFHKKITAEIAAIAP